MFDLIEQEEGGIQLPVEQVDADADADADDGISLMLQLMASV